MALAIRKLSTLSAVAAALLCAAGATIPAALAQTAAAPSTVNALYVEPSPTRVLRPNEKIGDLFRRNVEQPYVLQRLSSRVYWYQAGNYGTIFYVGDKGVLMFDALEGHFDAAQKAVAQVTRLPIRALVYSHDHADHIGDAPQFVDAAKRQGIKLRIIASAKTAQKQRFLGSKLPAPTEVLAWPRSTFRFENLKVELHGFVHAAHTDDAGVWLLPSEGVAHVPDLVNPDQPPFWNFGGSENFVYYESNLNELDSLPWTYLSGGHGNIGSRQDIAFYRLFLADLKAAVSKAAADIPFGSDVDVSKINAHTYFLEAWTSDISKRATDALRPKYGAYYGYEVATPTNAKMVAMAMLSYR